MSDRWDALVVEAHGVGYRVELTDGLPRDTDAEIDYGSREIRVRAGLGERERCMVLEHELDHARRPLDGASIDRRYRSERLREEAWALDNSPEHQEDGG